MRLSHGAARPETPVKGCPNKLLDATEVAAQRTAAKMHQVMLQRGPRFRIKPEILAADLLWGSEIRQPARGGLSSRAWITDIFAKQASCLPIHASLSLLKVPLAGCRAPNRAAADPSSHPLLVVAEQGPLTYGNSRSGSLTPAKLVLRACALQSISQRVRSAPQVCTLCVCLISSGGSASALHHPTGVASSVAAVQHSRSSAGSGS